MNGGGLIVENGLGDYFLRGIIVLMGINVGIGNVFLGVLVILLRFVKLMGVVLFLLKIFVRI